VDNSFKTITSRKKIIDACVEQGFPLEDANKKLKENHFTEITEKSEADWYESMRQSYKNTSLRKKLIEKGKLQGLSRFEINTALQKHNLRCLNEYETMDYMESLGRKNVVDTANVRDLFQEENKSSREEIIRNGLKNKKNIPEINEILVKNEYEPLTIEEENKYKKILLSSGRNRESLILEAIKNNTKTTELNKILNSNNLSPLSQFEILDFEQKKSVIQKEKRENLISECIEEKKDTYEINELLKKHNFEELSEKEEKKIRQTYRNNPKQDNSNQISPQFQSLYKSAIKKYHPDVFSNPEEKSLANKRMQEINQAKAIKDYFKLKSLIEKYEKEDNNKNQAK